VGEATGALPWADTTKVMVEESRFITDQNPGITMDHAEDIGAVGEADTMVAMAPTRNTMLRVDPIHLILQHGNHHHLGHRGSAWEFHLPLLECTSRMAIAKTMGTLDHIQDIEGRMIVVTIHRLHHSIGRTGKIETGVASGKMEHLVVEPYSCWDTNLVAPYQVPTYIETSTNG
jgi:hypothetical protein